MRKTLRHIIHDLGYQYLLNDTVVVALDCRFLNANR